MAKESPPWEVRKHNVWMPCCAQEHRDFLQWGQRKWNLFRCTFWMPNLTRLQVFRVLQTTTTVRCEGMKRSCECTSLRQSFGMQFRYCPSWPWGKVIDIQSKIAHCLALYENFLVQFRVDQQMYLEQKGWLPFQTCTEGQLRSYDYPVPSRKCSDSCTIFPFLCSSPFRRCEIITNRWATRIVAFKTFGFGHIGVLSDATDLTIVFGFHVLSSVRFSFKILNERHTQSVEWVETPVLAPLIYASYTCTKAMRGPFIFICMFRFGFAWNETKLRSLVGVGNEIIFI